MMNILLLSFLIGMVAATLDIIPMLVKKLPKAACISAFLQYVVVSVLILNSHIPYVVWWLQGGLISLAMALPIIVIIAENDKKSIPVILINAAILGTLIGLAGHFFVKP